MSLACVIGQLGEMLDGTRPVRLQSRQRSPRPDPFERDRLVGGVFDPTHLASPQIVAQLLAPAPEQWADDPIGTLGANAHQTSDTHSVERSCEHRLGLIVECMAGRDRRGVSRSSNFLQRRVARVSRSSLEVGRIESLEPGAVERNPQRFRQRFDVACLGRGLGPQTVIDARQAQRDPELCG